MSTWLIIVVLAALVIVAGLALVLWWQYSDRAARWDIDIDRQWAEMQIEQLGREARAQMYRAVDEARSEQRPDRS